MTTPLMQSTAHRITKLNSRTRTKPSTDKIVSITVHDLNVSTTVNPKYSLTNQNPASLTCERINEPEPVARTINSRLTVGSCSTICATSPAAVIVATVAEPVAIRTKAATPQPRSNGDIFAWVAHVPTRSDIFVAMSICLKPPPAPTIKTTAAMGARLFPTTCSAFPADQPRRKPSATITKNNAIRSAVIGSPTQSIACFIGPDGLASSTTDRPSMRTGGKRIVTRTDARSGGFSLTLPTVDSGR